MRILGIGHRVYLGDIYASLLRDGHEVRVFADAPAEQRAHLGLIGTVDDWRAELGWVGRDGVIMFERVGQGALQDQLRAEGYRVVGGSALGDRLENDRGFGQAVLRDAGLPVAPSHAFASPAAAAGWLARHPGRYVLKHDNSAHTTFVGEHAAGADLAFMLRRAAADPGGGGVLLMDRLDGVEVGVGAYFDGRRFLRPANLDFEHKRFFPGELGEMTGEMGTLAAFEDADRLFDASLGRVAAVLARAGHVGYVNLNMMVNEDGIWPLEFTCRFGNPGFAVLAALQTGGWGEVLARMAAPGTGDGRIGAAPGWSVCIVLTTPPFPGWGRDYEPGEDLPVFFHEPPAGREQANYHLVDVRQADGQLFVRKRSGHAMIVTGTGPTVGAAQDAARRRARNVVVPDLRWRADIGDRFLHGERDRLRALGWLSR